MLTKTQYLVFKSSVYVVGYLLWLGILVFLWWLSGFDFNERGKDAFFGAVLVVFTSILILPILGIVFVESDFKRRD